MIVLHAGFLDGELLLWGEVPPGPEIFEIRSRKGKSTPRRSFQPLFVPLRMTPGKERLLAALQEAGFNRKSDKKSIRTQWLSLATHR